MPDAAPKRTRLHYLDWLRVFATASVFLFHSDKPFALGDWFVLNSTRTLASTIHVAFFTQWMMPFFFVLSGGAICYSLRVRSVGRFVRERMLRLLVPFLFLGLFVLAPPQVYIDRLAHGAFSDSFLPFYAQYFRGFDAFGGDFAWHGVHMWYLLYLFAFSILWLPLIAPRKKTGMSLLAKSAPFFRRPGALLLLGIPLAGMDLLADALGLGFMRATGGWTFLSYLLFLPVGYLLFCTSEMQETVRRHTWASLGLAVVLSSLGLTIQLVWRPAVADGSWAYYGLTLLRSVRALCWIVAILGIGGRLLNFGNRFVRYANEAALPFYILHNCIIILVSYYGVLRWSLPIGAKYALVVLLSFVAIMVLYSSLIRRFDVLRFLYGMRSKERAANLPQAIFIPDRSSHR